MPAEQAQIRLMTATPVTLHALIPAPDQVTPEKSYYHYLNFYKKTLFHTPFLSRGCAVTSQEYKDAQVQLEVDHWFRTQPMAVQKYLLPLQSARYESIFIETQHNKKNIVVGEIYRIPDTNLRTSINRYDTIISKLTDTNKDLIIATDQNCDYLTFDQHKNTEDLLNIFLNNGIIPTITKPTTMTHTSATLIDNIYSIYQQR